MSYWSLRGIVKAAVATNGVPGVFRDFGNAPQFDFSLAQEFAEHYESRTGADGLDARWGGKKTLTINAIFEDMAVANIALALQGAQTTQSITPVVGEVLLAGNAVAGDILRLAKSNVSSLTVSDNAGAKVLGTDYSASADDLAFGQIRVLAPMTGPITAGYTPGAAKTINMFTQPEIEMWFLFDGVNKSDGYKKVRAEFYRARVPAAKLIKLIGGTTDVATPLEFEIAVLADSTKETDTLLGQFGRIVTIG